MNEDKIQRFAEWLATLPEERVPKTQKELAMELGVKEPQLSIWKKELDLQSAKPSEIKIFLDAIYKHAIAGKNAAYATTWWNITHPKDEGKKEAEFTADDYINIGIKVTEQLRNSLREGGGSCPVCGKSKEVCNEPCLDTEPGKEEDREVATVAVPLRPD